jgi:hypothetical protein
MKQLKLTFLLSVLMSMVGAEALAYNFKVDGICYDFYDGSSVEVAANSQYSGNIVIPSTVDYNGKTYNVVRIGYRAFAETYHLESITIPLSVTSIGDYAFSGSLITAIDIPSSVVRIGDYVFNKQGKIVKVLATYDNPQVEMCKITFSDGNTIKCCLDHLWEINTRTGKPRTFPLLMPLRWRRFRRLPLRSRFMRKLLRVT